MEKEGLKQEKILSGINQETSIFLKLPIPNVVPDCPIIFNAKFNATLSHRSVNSSNPTAVFAHSPHVVCGPAKYERITRVPGPGCTYSSWLGLIFSEAR